MAGITITHPDIGTKTVFEGRITYQWKNMVTAYPIEGGYTIQEPVKTGWENPLINLLVYFPDQPSSYYTTNSILSWSDFNVLLRNQYDGTSSTKATITITAGTNDTLFSSHASASAGVTAIPFEIKSASVNLDPAESKDGGLWTASVNLVETV